MAELLDCLKQNRWSLAACRLDEIISTKPSERRNSKELETDFTQGLNEARGRGQAQVGASEAWYKQEGLKGGAPGDRLGEFDRLAQEADLRGSVKEEADKLRKKCEEAADGREGPEEKMHAYQTCLASVHEFMEQTQRQHQRSRRANSIWGRTAANMTHKLTQFENVTLPLQAALADHSSVTDALMSMADDAQAEVSKMIPTAADQQRAA